jgi:hypothetical protein
MLMQAFGLHVAAIAVHELADVARLPARGRAAYLAVWMALTVAIVGVGLFRIRAARSAARAAARAERRAPSDSTGAA